MNQLNNYENPNAGSALQEQNPQLFVPLQYLNVVNGAVLSLYQHAAPDNQAYENA